LCIDPPEERIKLTDWLGSEEDLIAFLSDEQVEFREGIFHIAERRMLNRPHVEVPISAEVIFESNGERVCSYQFAATEHMAYWTFGGLRPKFAPSAVTIRFRPDRHFAYETLSDPDPPKEIYGGEIVLENVPVKQSD